MKLLVVLFLIKASAEIQNGPELELKVKKPFSRHAVVTLGSSVELIWQYSSLLMNSGNKSTPTRMFCGYHNKEEEFVFLAVDFNGKEFRIPAATMLMADAPKDDKNMLPRIKNAFAQNHDTKTNERGFTISAFKSTDAGTVTCGIQPRHEDGITYQGEIRLEVNSTTKPVLHKHVNIFGIFIPKWATWTVSSLFGFILLGVASSVMFLYRKRTKGRQALAGDRKSLLDVVSSDEDEILEYQRQVDKKESRSVNNNKQP